MKYTQVSGTLISLIQYSALVSAVLGAFFVNWSLSWILIALVFYYLYSAVGVSMVLHRYWSHKSFEFKHPLLKWIFTGIAVLAARGSPIAWVHIHRQHHAYSDTSKDPHRPGKFSFFSFKSTYIEELKLFLIKDVLTPGNKIIHEYYLLFLVAFWVLLACISPSFLYFAWILPVCTNQLSQDLWNYFSHVDVGYRTYSTKDNSRNVIWLWPLILGEAWHNNHHHSAKLTTKHKWWEFDPVDSIINLVKK